MSRILFYLFLLFVGWKVHELMQPTALPLVSQTPALSTPSFNQPQAQAVLTNQTAAFSCDGRQYCSQMRSRDEALFFIQNCPNTKMDGDHDGNPCEQQFGF